MRFFRNSSEPNTLPAIAASLLIFLAGYAEAQSDTAEDNRNATIGSCVAIGALIIFCCICNYCRIRATQQEQAPQLEADIEADPRGTPFLTLHPNRRA